MSEILEDAFKIEADVKVYGDNIEVDNYHAIANVYDLPDSKSNNVSFMKVEELSNDCKNLLAVSESCICYSVTQKKNLLRLIDTVTGDKEILRGHEGAITDVKFSTVDSTVLCSTDISDNVAGKPHTIVWKKNDTGISFDVTTQMQLKGVLLVAHPLQSNVWAISDKKHVGVFCSARVNLKSPSQYAELSMSVSFGSDFVVTDVAFTPNGRHVVVSLSSTSLGPQTYFQIYRISGQQDSPLKGNESLTRVYSHPQQPASSDVVAIKFVRNIMVTASRAEEQASTSDSVKHTLLVWEGLEGDDPQPRVVQTVTVELPVFQSKISSSSLKNPLLECALHVEQRSGRYLMFSSRRSALVACLAVVPSGVTGSPLPLYHVTYINLKAPVVSMDVTSILGREHHSAEEGEHLELSCYQEEASEQASIQQYHVVFAHLFDWERQLAERKQARTSSHNSLVELGAGGLLSRGNSVDMGALEPVASVEVSKGKTILSLLNSANSGGKSSFVSTPVVTPAPKVSSAEQTNFSTPDHSTAQRATGMTVGISPMSYFTNPGATETKKKEPKEVDTTGLPSFLNFEPTKNTSILSMIKSNSAPSNTVPAPITSTKAATPDKQPAADKKEGKKEVKSEKSGQVAADHLLTKEKLQAVQDKVHNLAKERSEQQQKNAEVQPSSDKKIEKLVVSSVVDDRSETSSISSAPLSKPAASGTPATKSSSISSSIEANGTPASMLSSLADIKQAVRAIAKSAVTAEALTTAKEEIMRDSRASSLKAAEQTQVATRKLLDSEVKKSVEAALGSGKWKQELSALIADSLQAELAPLIAQKVRESVKDTVRDTVKAVLTTSFRSAFDNSLVPAFQVGTERLFAQVQTSFESGMSGLAKEGQKVQQNSARSTESLESEIRELKHTVHSLETILLDLSDRVSALASVGFKQQEEEEQAIEDPFMLLERGLVSDAVLRALEDKDVSITISLLDRLTPSQVNSKCSNLVRLCITQQLAADMSVNVPEEGIAKRVEWIKNLVLSLVSGPATAGSDPTYDRSFKSTIQLVLESIQTAKRLVFSGDESSAQVPQSVGTDLQLLEFVIQSKL